MCPVIVDSLKLDLVQKPFKFVGSALSLFLMCHVIVDTFSHVEKCAHNPVGFGSKDVGH